MYKSGLVVWRSGVKEDYSQAFAGQNVISFIGLIYSVTEWLLFARRFFEKILSVDENIVIAIQASDMQGRRLIAADSRVELDWEYRMEIPEFSLTETVAVSELRADPEMIARRIVRKIFELFNWNDPSDKMLESWQQKLIQRQF